MRARSNISNLGFVASHHSGLLNGIFNALGLVASHKRIIKSGSEYEKYFDTSAVEGDEIDLGKGTVYDTLGLMKKIVKQTLPQTKKIAQKLKGKDVETTCKNIWDFLYNHFQYNQDVETREQIRTPIRSWKDRKKGIDCDCFSVFAASCLTNLKIKNKFRMAAYDKDGKKFQHVYVVVDPVLNEFNEEAPFKGKHDHTMLGNATCNTKPIFNRLRRYISTEQVRELGYVPTQQFLEQNNIPYTQVIDEETEGGMFQIATPSGDQNIKPILTNDEAQAVLQSLATSSPMTQVVDNTNQQPTAAISVASDSRSMKKFPWLLAAAAAIGAVILITGTEDRPAPQALAGPPKLKIKKRSKAEKLKPLYV